MKTLTLSIIAIMTAAWLTGCASPAQPQAMIPTQFSVAHRNPEKVSITVAGGRETSATGPSQISNSDFREALKQAIINSGLFAEVVDTNTGRYRLDAFIGMLSQPMLGASMTVSMEVSYNLIDLKENKSIWQQSISSHYTAAWDAAFAGVTRLRLANEGAARDNIDRAITEMGKLQLNQ